MHAVQYTPNQAASATRALDEYATACDAVATESEDIGNHGLALRLGWQAHRATQLAKYIDLAAPLGLHLTDLERDLLTAALESALDRRQMH